MTTLKNRAKKMCIEYHNLTTNLNTDFIFLTTKQEMLIKIESCKNIEALQRIIAMYEENIELYKLVKGESN